jgi:hypothetical protein
MIATTTGLRRFASLAPAFLGALACCGLALAAPAGAAGSFDGTYKGTQTVLRTNNTQACNSLAKDDLALVVKDNHFSRGWYEVVVGVDVAPDGTDHQSVQTTIGRRMAIVQVDGKITGPKLEADIGTSTCAAHLSLTKS